MRKGDSLPANAIRKSGRFLFESFKSIWATALFDRLFNRFTGFAGVLLNPAKQLLGLAYGALDLVVREFGPLLFQLALDDINIAFGFECGHKICDFAGSDRIS